MNILPKILFQLNKKQKFFHRSLYFFCLALFNLGKLWNFCISLYIEIQFRLAVFFVWLEVRKDFVRNFHPLSLPFCLFVCLFCAEYFKQAHLPLVLHPQLSIGCPKELNVFSKSLVQMLISCCRIWYWEWPRLVFRDNAGGFDYCLPAHYFTKQWIIC